MSAIDSTSDVSRIQKDILWGMYLDFHSQSRHNETQRSNAVNFVLILSSALIAVITYDKEINRFDLPLCFIIMIMGLIGSLFSASFTELTIRDWKKGEYILRQLDHSYFENQAEIMLIEIQAKALVEHRKSRVYRWSRGITGSAQIFWLIPPLCVLVIGILLTVLAVSM